MEIMREMGGSYELEKEAKEIMGRLAKLLEKGHRNVSIFMSGGSKFGVEAPNEDEVWSYILKEHVFTGDNEKEVLKAIKTRLQKIHEFCKETPYEIEIKREYKLPQVLFLVRDVLKVEKDWPKIRTLIESGKISELEGKIGERIRERVLKGIEGKDFQLQVSMPIHSIVRDNPKLKVVNVGDGIFPEEIFDNIKGLEEIEDLETRLKEPVDILIINKRLRKSVNAFSGYVNEGGLVIKRYGDEFKIYKKMEGNLKKVEPKEIRTYKRGYA